MNTLPQFSAPNTGAIRFADIDNESVAVAHDPALSAANFTVEAWVTTTNTDADLNRVLVKPVATDQTYSIIVTNGEAQILSNVGVVTSTGVTVADGVPHHIAGVYDSVAETLTLYVDGALISSVSTAGQTLVQGTSNVFIGDFPGAVVEAFDGDISDVRIWSDVRTTEEIAATFDQSLDGGAPNLELHLRFDGDATDSSGNGRDGIINGAPVFVEGLAPVDPVAFAPTPLAATEDVPEAITDLQVSDADPGAVLTVTVEAASGTLTLGTTAGLTFTAGANGTLTFSAQGTVADLNAALATLSYQGDLDFNGIDDIILTVDDGEPEVVEPVAGAQVIPNSGTFFLYDFDTGVGFTEAQTAGVPVGPPTNGFYVNINPNNDHWSATATVVIDGVATFLPPENFDLVGYAGASSIVGGESVRFEDAITGLTLIYTNEDTPTPTGARDITFTFNGLDFNDMAPGDMNLDDADFRMSSEAVQSIPVTVAAVNDDPVAADDFITISENTLLLGDLFADNGSGPDSDVDLDALTVTQINGAAVTNNQTIALASGASLTIRSDGTFDYDSFGLFDPLANGETDSDTFTYEIIDGNGGVSTASVILTISGANDAPIAVDDMITADEDNIVSGDLFVDNGLGPDFDIDNGAILEVIEIDGVAVSDGDVVTLGSGANLTIRADGTFDYDPNGQFENLAFGATGVDGFTYTITDSETASPEPIGGALTIPAHAAFILDFDTGMTSSELNFGASVPPINGVVITLNPNPSDFEVVAEIYENGVRTFASTDFSLLGYVGASGPTVAGQRFRFEDDIPNLELTWSRSGVPSPTGPRDVTFTFANLNFVDDAAGSATIGSSVVDSGAPSISVAPVTLMINGVNDAPVAQDDMFAGDEDTLITASLFADNGNGIDDDIDGGVFTVTQIDGITVTDGQMVTTANGAGLTIRSDGTFDYDPMAAFDPLADGELGIDSFTYTITDDQGAISTAIASFNITGVNDAPIAADDNITTDEDTIFTGSLLDDNGFGPDTDIDNGTILAVTEIDGIPVFDGEVVPLPSGAQLTIRTDGSFDYNPSGAFENLGQGQTATESFTYTVMDDFGATSTATAFVTVTGVNDPPTAFDDNIVTDEDTVFSFSLFADSGFGADVDVEVGSMISVTEINGAPVTDGQMVTLPSGAILTIRANGTYDYDPNGAFEQLAQGETQPDIFNYTIADEFGATATATAFVTINGVNDAPVAADDNFSTDQNNVVAGDLFADNNSGPDIDPDNGAILSIAEINGTGVFDGESVVLPSGAMLLIRADGTFDYDPNGAFDNLPEGVTSPDSFTYTVTDEFGATSIATANVTVFGQNDAPIAFDESFDLDEDTPTTGDLFIDNNSDGNLSFDPDGDPFLVTQINGVTVSDGEIITLPSGASLTIRLDGTFDYDPLGQFETLAAGATGADSFTFQIEDPLGAASTATANLNIVGVNDAPVALFDDFTTAADTPVSGDLTADNGFGADFDIDIGDILSVTAINGQTVTNGQVVALPSGANLTIRSDGTFDFDPAGAFDALGDGESANETFTYTLSDGQGGTSDATAGLFITGVNDPPVAANDAFTAAEDAGFSGDVLADNGFGPDIDPEASLDLAIIAVNGAAFTDNAPITLPSGAVLTFRADGTFDYDPAGAFEDLAAGAVGADSFTYTLSDELGATSQATADIAITGANDAPVALADDFTTAADTPVSGDLTADNGFGADLDIDVGDILSVTAINGQTVTDGQVVALPSGANLTIRSDGTFDYDPAGAFDALGDGESANETFTYTLSDGQGGTSDATAGLFITGVNDPPVAANDAFTAAEDAGFSGDVIADNGFGPDTDPDVSAILSVTEVNGVAVIDNAPITLSSGAILTFRTDGTFDYDPSGAFEALAAGAFGADSFSYTLSDEIGATSQATVDIAITGANDAPVAANDAFEATEQTGFSGDVTADNGFGADSDPDTGDVLSVTEINGAAVTDGSAITLPSGAVLTFRTDGTFDYDPAGAFDALAVGDFGADSFTYTLSDGAGGVSTGTADIAVEGVNEPPVVQDDAFTVAENSSISGNFFADNGQGADTDGDGDALIIAQVADLFPAPGGAPISATLASGAAVTFASDGTFTYEAGAAFDSLAAGETATEQFSYFASDQQGGVTEGVATFTVTGVNDAPVASDDTFSTDEDTAIGGLFLLADNGAGADTDEDGDILSLTSIEGVAVGAGDTVALASGAEVTVGADGDIAYDPNAAFEDLESGQIVTDSFVYQVSDGQGGTSDATARIEIAGVNDILFGTDDIDVMQGTSEADDIRALDGRDFVSGFAGNDTIDGGGGNDRARGGLGDDSISGGEGNDALFGEGGDDVLAGGDGNDRLRGQRGDDRLLGEDGDDVLAGARGSDTLMGGEGADTLAGGGGNDRLRGQAGDDKLGGSRGDDMLLGGLGGDRIRGGGGNDTLNGGIDDDTLIGGAGADVFQFAANDGSDIIRRFQQDTDLIEITSDAIGFSDLSIAQQGANVVINFAATEVLLTAQSRDDFSADDFIFFV